MIRILLNLFQFNNKTLISLLMLDMILFKINSKFGNHRKISLKKKVNKILKIKEVQEKYLIK